MAIQKRRKAKKRNLKLVESGRLVPDKNDSQVSNAMGSKPVDVEGDRFRMDIQDSEKRTPGQPQTQRRPPIIDMHMHADLPPHDVPPGAPALCRPEPCCGDGHATANHTETLKKTLDMMDRYNIVKAFVSGIDLRIVQQWVDAAPGRFLAGPFILQPGRPDPELLND